MPRNFSEGDKFRGLCTGLHIRKSPTKEGSTFKRNKFTPNDKWLLGSGEDAEKLTTSNLYWLKVGRGIPF